MCKETPGYDGRGIYDHTEDLSGSVCHEVSGISNPAASICLCTIGFQTDEDRGIGSCEGSVCHLYDGSIPKESPDPDPDRCQCTFPA